MKLLEEYTTPVVMAGVATIPVPVGVSTQQIGTSVEIPLALFSQNNRLTWSRLVDTHLLPSVSGVVSLESAYLLIVTNVGLSPLYRSLSPSSLTALLDGNVLGLASQWILPGAAVLSSFPGVNRLITISAWATMNNSSAAVVDVSSSPLVLLGGVELYDSPQYD